MTGPQTRSGAGDLTQGDLLRPMLRVAWPLVVIQLLQVMYNVADTFWLGRLSADAVGALSLAFPLVFLFISVGGGFTAAGAILVAQHTGASAAAGDEYGDRTAGHVAGTTMGVVMLVSLVIAVVGYLSVESLLGLLPASAATADVIVPLAGSYMRVFFLAMPFLFGFFVFTALMRGYGDTRGPMRVMFLSVALNVALDPVLIFGWGPVPAFGIEGAAWATLVARAAATVVGWYVLFGTSAGPDVRLGDLVPELDIVRDVVRLGVPTGLEQSGTAFAFVVLTAMVSTFPPAVVGAYGLGNRMVSLVFLPAMGLSQAVNTVVGQNLGARRDDRAWRAVRAALTAVVAVMIPVSLFAAAFPGPIVEVFLPAEGADAAATVGYASTYLRTAAVMFAFTGVFEVGRGAFRGAGRTTTALVFSLIALWGVRVPVTYLLAFEYGWGTTGIWWAVVAGDVVGAVLVLGWLLHGTWTKTVVDGPRGAPTDD
ncbi:MATE family efflux transporter [Candidatus Halobonum tyrrellensis]|uniref:Multidrug-efflux transporter n=1 Tax=Candidatus Halobonum tyrrellensis G22 TaxID=1324957 RepID=V4IWA1_9EURY|nr:MATE family efflux transporter [Candidatus Halobonum tyrrellensis]ESP87457.1 MATE efflux family protein [Candidatus Halobonum tyrrellensis G22]